MVGRADAPKGNSHRNTESTADWNASSENGKWTVPINLGISQILKIGKQPISIQIGGKYYADPPRYGPDWGLASNNLVLSHVRPHPAQRSGLTRGA